MNRILITLLFFLIALNPSITFSQNWQALGSGMNGNVLALTVYNGELVAGGTFTIAGGVSANNIAKWNGTSWQPMGTGMNNAVYALAVYNGNLYAGGYFTVAGGIAANCIAKWDGMSWAPLNSGMNSYVSALTVYNNSLIAGGAFTLAGGVSASAIAAWNGNQWSEIGFGMNNEVHSLTVFNNKLIAGGKFSSPANRLARWDGVSWSAFPFTINNLMGSSVFALLPYQGRLTVGGPIIIAGMFSNCAAQWDTVAHWQGLGGGMNAFVNAFVLYNNQLIAGGAFTGPNTGNKRIALWSGTNWDSIGSGFNGDVSALTVFNGQLIAGGIFQFSGASSVNYIARWGNEVSVTPISSEIPVGFKLHGNYPNPFNPETNIKFDIPHKGTVKIQIYSSSGLEIANVFSGEFLPGRYSVKWNAAEYASGIYYCRVTFKEQVNTNKMVLIK